MKQLGVLLLPLDGMLVHHRAPSMKQLGALLLPLDEMLVHYRVPSMKQLGALLLPLDVMLVHRRVPSMKQLGALLLPLDGILVLAVLPPACLWVFLGARFFKNPLSVTRDLKTWQNVVNKPWITTRSILRSTCNINIEILLTNLYTDLLQCKLKKLDSSSCFDLHR